MTRTCALLVVGVLLGAPGCGGPETDAADAAAAASPVGRWKFDREALLAALAKAHEADGPARVAQEQERARETNLELEILPNGFYRMRTLSLDLEQRSAGSWRLEGSQLLLTAQRVDGRQVETPREEEARFVEGRIEIDFDKKTFVLIRL